MILVNGLATSTIPATDRGFAYGDGVFRTLAARNGVPRAWRHQYAKLASDAGTLGISCPGEATLREEVRRVTQDEPACVVKIVLTRGAAGRGYGISAPVVPTRVVMSSPWPQHPAEWQDQGVAARLCRLRLAWQPALAGIKHLNRLENVLARAEWCDPAIAEGLLLDSKGNVIGGTMSNVFIAEAGRIATPELGQCGVAGVTRDRVLEGARHHGIACVVEPVTLDRLLAAEEVTLVNSLIGAWQVRSIENKSWGLGPLTAQVRCWLDADEP